MTLGIGRMREAGLVLIDPGTVRSRPIRAWLAQPTTVQTRIAAERCFRNAHRAAVLGAGPGSGPAAGGAAGAGMRDCAVPAAGGRGAMPRS